MTVLDIDTKQSDGEVLVMLELWGMWSTLSLPLLPSPLWHGVVGPDMVLFMGQIELNWVLMLNWIVWNRTVYMYKNGFGINNPQWLMYHQTKPNRLFLTLLSLYQCSVIILFYFCYPGFCFVHTESLAHGLTTLHYSLDCINSFSIWSFIANYCSKHVVICILRRRIDESTILKVC